MKRIIALTLSLIIAISISVVSADSTEYTRFEICTAVAELFGIEPDGDIKPLLAYNDWASVSGADRYLAAAVVKSGIFVPKTPSFAYDEPMTQADYDCLTLCMNLYALRTEGYNFISGNIWIGAKNKVVISDNYENKVQISPGVPVINGVAIQDNFENITSGAPAECVYDDEGNCIIAWVKSESSASVTYMYKGSLYVNDTVNGNLIFNKLSILRDDTWVKTKDRYLTGAVCDETTLVYRNQKVALDDVNLKYLDRPASIIVGEKSGQPCILYVLFD